MTDTLEQDPAAIERDIRRTQDDMSRTIDRIGDQMTPRNIFNALLDKADENHIDARTLLDGARRNPIALGLMAAGAIWLISDKDSKFPSLPSRTHRNEGEATPDLHHRDYVDYMSAIEMREGEDHAAYQRRRDQARGNYFMLERGHEEDDQSFRQRLDEFADRFRAKRQAWSDGAASARDAAGRQAARSWDQTQALYESNPLVGGLMAAAVGAAIGAVLPISRTEQEALGGIGDQARAFAGDQKNDLVDALREQKDDLVDKAQDQLHPSQPDNQSTQVGAGNAATVGLDSGHGSFGTQSTSRTSKPEAGPPGYEWP